MHSTGERAASGDSWAAARDLPGRRAGNPAPGTLRRELDQITIPGPFAAKPGWSGLTAARAGAPFGNTGGRSTLAVPDVAGRPPCPGVVREARTCRWPAGVERTVPG